jgi:alcohol dehydrogenase class IV
MVHAIEAFYQPAPQEPLSDGLARQALALLSATSGRVSQRRNREARGNMLLGSMLAGMAFANAPVAAVHALAYPIGAIFHVPHGLSNALVLMGVLRFNLPAAETLYAELAATLDPAARDLPVPAAAERFVERWRRSAGIARCPAGLAAVGVGEGDLARLAEDAMKQTRLW